MNIKSVSQIKLILILALSILVLQGCSDYSADQTAISKYDALLLKFHTDRSWLKVGESVHAQFTVTNESESIWILETKETPVIDLIVEDAASRKILLSWAATNPEKLSHHVAWKPGESKALELTWTASERDFGRIIFLTGLLSKDSGIIQGAGVSVCVGYEICH